MPIGQSARPHHGSCVHGNSGFPRASCPCRSCWRHFEFSSVLSSDCGVASDIFAVCGSTSSQGGGRAKQKGGECRESCGCWQSNQREAPQQENRRVKMRNLRTQ